MRPATGEYRLPAATRPGKVRLQVADLDRSIAWYAGVLGLEPLIREEGTASLVPAAGAPASRAPASRAPAPLDPAAGAPSDAGPSVLVELVERKGVRPVPPEGHLGLFHVAFLLPGRSHLARFAEHLAGLDERVGSADHLVSEAFYLRDPDGLGIEVYADRPRSAWRRRDGEIIMTTEPLDVGSLVAASDGTPWKGMAGGTTVGHLHLRVGDLRRAEAFYHGGLGLDKVVWSYPGALFLSAGGYHHHLGVNSWAGSVQPARDDEARLLEWELVLPPEAPSGDGSAHADAGAQPLDQLAASLEEHGAPGERSGPDGTGEFITRDPWGTALRVRVGK